jgi:hypothetical protein
MSLLAETVAKVIVELPPQDREPVAGSILRAVDMGLYADVRGRWADLRSRGADDLTALARAIDERLSLEDRRRLGEVLAYASTQAMVESGNLSESQALAKAREHVEVFRQLDEIKVEDGGLGDFGISAIIAIVAAVASTAASGIASAVRKVRARRRALKTKLTPVNQAEIDQLLEATVTRFRSFREAEPALIVLIEQVRHGRSGWLLDPATGDDRGSRVNERLEVKQQWEARKAALDQALAAARTRKTLGYGVAAAIGSAAIVGLIAVLTR